MFSHMCPLAAANYHAFNTRSYDSPPLGLFQIPPGLDRRSPEFIYPSRCCDRRQQAQSGEQTQRHKLGTHARIAAPLSLRKSATALKSGPSRPVSHISSDLRALPVRASVHAHAVISDIDVGS